MRPYIIAVAGPSGSGKSALAARLERDLPAPAAHIMLDSYYRALDAISPADRALRNFDHPDALDAALFISQLDHLSRGQAIEQPVYLFDQHTRDAHTVRVSPQPFLLVEGILALYWKEARALYDLKVFVTTPDDVCFTRRLDRDVRERGRTPESIHDQYQETVRPMADQFVLPTREFADLVVSGQRPLDETVREVLARIPAFNEPRLALNRIYTKTGDKGETGLAGGQRVSKDALRIECYGTVDELNAFVGLAATSADDPRLAALAAILRRVQHELFNLGSILATLPKDVHPKQARITGAEIRQLESEIDLMNADLPALRSFVLPGGCRLNAELHACRTICRRAERIAVALARTDEVPPEAIQYLNRLSDALFVWSRWVNHVLGVPEILWQPNESASGRSQI